MERHLSDTREMRYMLRDRLGFNPGDSHLAILVLNEFESVLRSLLDGEFRLCTPQEFDLQHRSELCVALAAVSDADVALIQLGTRSFKQLMYLGDDRVQDVLYRLAHERSLGAILRMRERHSKLWRDAGAWYVPDRLIARVLEWNGLKDVLRRSGYGASFAEVFFGDIVTFFVCAFAHALKGDDETVAALLPLARIFRYNMPIGLWPPMPKAHMPPEADPHMLRWEVFVD